MNLHCHLERKTQFQANKLVIPTPPLSLEAKKNVIFNTLDHPYFYPKEITKDKFQITSKSTYTPKK